jgi:glucosamine--fructose-6-phosphate aminotransferase (isomerizing)
LNNIPNPMVEKNQMLARGKYTREEIFSQPEAWEQAIEVLRKQIGAVREYSWLDEYRQVIITGCGSTYYLSRAAAMQFQSMTGHPARGIPASELWLSPKANYIRGANTLLIAISRSGETSETLQACIEFRERKQGKIITLVCNPRSTLTRLSDLSLVFPSGMEQSIAQTRAFSTLFLGVVGMFAIWIRGEDNFNKMMTLPHAGRQIIDNYHLLAARLGRNLITDRIYFLGSGERYGLACELSLKMKEMCLTHSESFHFMEFRHGPKAMVNGNTLIVGLVSESNSRYELAVLEDVRNLGAETISVGEQNMDVSFNSRLEEVYRNVLYLPFGQMMAFERAIAKDLDPDHPTNLDAVVKLTKM